MKPVVIVDHSQKLRLWSDLSLQSTCHGPSDLPSSHEWYRFPWRQPSRYSGPSEDQIFGLGTILVFEMQTAAIRYALGSQHTYDFIEGSLSAPMAPGIESLVSDEDAFFQYAEESSAKSCIKAMDDLEEYIQSDGPFDGIMAFSQGAGLAAALMIRKFKEDPIGQRLSPLFKCAVFFSGAVPEDPSVVAQGGVRRLMRVEDDGEMIETPSAHIWGRKDQLYPQFGPVLSGLCKKSVRADSVHNGGHEIPGPRYPDALKEAVRCIERTIKRALEAQ